MIVTYDSNNSGGRWWLSDQDWQALADAGWNVHWNQPPGTESGFGGRPKSSYKEPLKPLSKSGYRWLGALACSAAKAFDHEDPDKAIGEWESITGQSASSIGCTCCGPPHSFEYIDEDGKEHYAYVTIDSTIIDWS